LQQLFNWLKDNKNIPYLTLIIDEYIDDIQLPSPNIAIVAGGGQDAVEGSRFLNAMLPIWARSKGRISLQKMVAAVHNQMAAELSITNYENDRLPKLFAYPEAAQQPLVRTSSAVRQMQALLRSTGYSNGSVNGVYNQETDTALRAWLSVQNITGTPSPEDILYRLQEEKKKKEREDPKIMLFVFSNPDGQLPFVGDEQERLFALADDMEKRSGAELILLNSPSREELRIYFTEPTYRNQITLFHFSGFEADPQGNGRERGLFLQKDGEKDLIDYGELHHWLDFQENIRLFYLNTCYSSNLAKTLTIRGVQAAIGAPALVDDRYASNFALEFYQNMLTGLSLKDAFDRIDIRPSSEGQHRMAVMNEEAAFAGFQLFSDWGRREEILNWRWGRVEEQAQAKEEKPRKTATGLYLETLKELLNENEVEAALDRLEKYDGLFMLDFVSDLLSLKSRYIQTKREFEDGKLPQAQYDRNKNQVRFSLQNIIDEIPRKMAIQKSTGEARWMDFTLPAEEDMVKFEKKEELLEWLGKGL
jgi:peptidoglycan hydrolase-like protein with peptidoglycan-binding domain